MRANYFLLGALTFFAITVKAQNSCPIGYELRNVKCINSPSMTQQCIPSNYTCNSCWQVEWQRCNGTGKGYENASSYEGALKIANDRIKNMESCKGSLGLDYKNYRIFISGGDYCTGKNPALGGTGNSGSSGDNGGGSGKLNNSNSTNTSNSNYNQAQGSSRDLQLQTEIQFFYVQHHNAEEKLEDIKKKYPANAMLYENNYRGKLQQLLNSVKSEDTKNNASIETVKAFRRQLDELIQQMASAETMALNNSNTQKTQNQQYQNQANNYLNQAQNTNQSAITQQLNLDLAKTNAMMAGNTQQVQQIQQIQNQKKYENNIALINTIGGLVQQSLQNSLNQKLAAYDNFRAKSEQLADLKWQLRKESNVQYENGDNKKAFELLYSSSFVACENAYNNWMLESWYVLGKFSKSPLKKYLFNVSSNSTEYYEHLNLPIALPAILNAPFLNCFQTDFIRNMSYDTAFGFLRDCNKSSIFFRGNTYKIKCVKKANTNYNEDSALYRLKSIVLNPPAFNTIDVIDFLNAAVWIAFLQSKNAKTKADLYKNVSFLCNYYSSIHKIINPEIVFDNGENDFMEIYESLIQYFFMYDLYRLNENTSDTQTGETLKNIFELIKTPLRDPDEPRDISAYYQQNSVDKKPIQAFNDKIKQTELLFAKLLQDISQSNDNGN